MLSKLIKHEFRATARVMLPLYAAMACAAIVARISTWYLESVDQTPVISALSGLGIGIFVFSVIAVTIMSVIMVVNRFMKNLMADEGYIMFTLPVTTHQIIFSKVIVALVWYIGTAIADMIALVVAWADASFADGMAAFFKQIFAAFTKMKTAEQLNIAGYAVEILVALVLSMVAVTLIFYCSISIGHSFANHKILLSVVFFLGITFILEILSISGLVGVAGMDWIWCNYSWDEMQARGIIHGLMLGGIAAEAAVSAAFYFITHTMIKHRLNLG